MKFFSYTCTGTRIYILKKTLHVRVLTNSFWVFLQLEITEFIPTLLYFGYTLLMVFTFWILTGTIGFYAAYFFIRKIYGAIKID